MRYFIFTFFSLLILACNKKKETKRNNLNDTIIVYNADQLYKLGNGVTKVKIIDTACVNAEKRALNDIKKGKIVYYFFNGMTDMYRSNKEMEQILSEYKIQIDSAMTSCIPPPKGFRRNCYISIMQNEIEKRHGANFIDSIRVLAERKFVGNHPNLVFKFDECDTISRYPNTKNYSDFFNKPKEDFDKIFIYPKDYKYKTEKFFSSTDVSFILDKNGKINNIETDCNFANSKNNKFAEYFKIEAVKFVKKTKWIPAKFRGINVNSEMHFLYFHK